MVQAASLRWVLCWSIRRDRTGKRCFVIPAPLSTASFTERCGAPRRNLTNSSHSPFNRSKQSRLTRAFSFERVQDIQSGGTATRSIFPRSARLQRRSWRDYQRLRAACPSVPLLPIWNRPKHSFAIAFPERFLSVTDGVVETDRSKGTARGRREERHARLGGDRRRAQAAPRIDARSICA